MEDGWREVLTYLCLGFMSSVHIMPLCDLFIYFFSLVAFFSCWGSLAKELKFWWILNNFQDIVIKAFLLIKYISDEHVGINFNLTVGENWYLDQFNSFTVIKHRYCCSSLSPFWKQKICLVLLTFSHIYKG